MNLFGAAIAGEMIEINQSGQGKNCQFPPIFFHGIPYDVCCKSSDAFCRNASKSFVTGRIWGLLCFLYDRVCSA